MPIELSPQTEALIREKVKQGLYANADEAIAAAVRVLDEHDHRLTRLRTAIATGERRGTSMDTRLNGSAYARSRSDVPARRDA